VENIKAAKKEEEEEKHEEVKKSNLTIDKKTSLYILAVIQATAFKREVKKCL
jgi:hypothetical protein